MIPLDGGRGLSEAVTQTDVEGGGGSGGRWGTSVEILTHAYRRGQGTEKIIKEA